MIHFVLFIIFTALVLSLINQYFQHKEIENLHRLMVDTGDTLLQVGAEVVTLQRQFEAKRQSENRKTVAKTTATKKSPGVIASAKKAS